MKLKCKENNKMLNFIKGFYWDLKKDQKKAILWYLKSGFNFDFINKRLGSLFLKLQQWQTAQKYFNEIKNKDAISWYRYGLTLEKQGLFYEAAKAFKEAISMRKDWFPWKDHYVKCLLNVSYDPRYSDNDLYLPQNINEKDFCLLKAKNKHANKQYWEEINILKNIITENPEDYDIYLMLGHAYTKLRNFKKAIECYCVYKKFLGLKNNVCYHIGYAYEQQNDTQNSEKYYRIEEINSNITIEKLHNKYKRFKEASLVAFEKKSKVFLADVAKQLEQCFQYEKAKTCYMLKYSVTSDPEYAYKSGKMSECLGNFAEAIQFYKHALSRKSVKYWYYRLGYCLEKLNKFEEACIAYKQSVDTIASQNDLHSLSLNNHKNKNYFPYSYYIKKANDLYDSKIYRRACNCYKLSRELIRIYVSDRVTYKKNANFRFKARYNEYRECIDVVDDLFVFESFAGRKIACNPYALYGEFSQREEYRKCTFVWCIDQLSLIPEEIKSDSRCVFVKRNSILYVFFIAVAKYLINNSTFDSYFIRRKSQIYLNTWHGTPFKSMGKDIKTSFLEHRNTQRNFLQASFILTSNKHSSYVFTDRYDLRLLCKHKILEFGYPRLDMTLSKEVRKKTRELLRIPKDKFMVLFAPTFRGWMGFQTDIPLEIENAFKKIKNLDCQLYFNCHYFYDNYVQKKFGNKYLLPKNLDINKALAATDILITDYSSIAFDFMATEKEIIYYVYDEEEYARDRGLYMSSSYFSGKKCKTPEELYQATKESLVSKWEPDELYIRRKNEFCCHDRGNTTKKIVDFLSGHNLLNIADNKEKVKILFYAGPFAGNGITHSFLNLTKNIDYKQYDITLIVEGNLIYSDKIRYDLFKNINNNVNILGVTGGMLYSIDEEHIKYLFNQMQYYDDENMRNILNNAFKREFQRLFGDARFDYVIQFDGYSRYWTSVFANANCKKAIYLHNTMEREKISKYPSLEDVFKNYRCFDKLISVSERLSEENKKYFKQYYGIEECNFAYVENPQDFYDIKNKSKEIVEESFLLLIENRKSFITVGRLSIEKDHIKLIRAFASAHFEDKNICLFILGQGPLYEVLISEIRKLKAESYIYLMGYKTNPYKYISRCDCFIFPSNHEGQPMVLLEAMALNKDIIATDIPGNAGVLKKYHYGTLVENSEESIKNEILKYKPSNNSNNIFDTEIYNQKCMEEFYEIIKNV